MENKKCRVEDGLRYCYCGKCKRTGYPLSKDIQRIYNLMMEKLANQEMPPIINSSDELLPEIERPGFKSFKILKYTWYNRVFKWLGFYGGHWIFEPERILTYTKYSQPEYLIIKANPAFTKESLKEAERLANEQNQNNGEKMK